MHDVSDGLARIVRDAAPRLRALSDAAASLPRAPGKWSRKEILGHLIDSSANNLQRFVRMQLAPHVELPGYAQDAWVRVCGYGSRDWAELVGLWEAVNRHLIEVIRRIDPAALRHTWTDPDGQVVDLEWVARDYLRHLEHHLGQI